MIVAKNATESIELAVKELTSENVVVLPTDTVYGFSGIVPCTENKIREIKGRDETKPFIRLISEPDEIYRYTEDIVPKELIDMWPGALTVIVTLKKELSLFEGETVGFRCPGDQWLRTVISKCGYPVFSSSVNKSGCPLLNTVEEINAENHFFSIDPKSEGLLAYWRCDDGSGKSLLDATGNGYDCTGDWADDSRWKPMPSSFSLPE